MPPTKEKIEEFDIHPAWFLQEQTSAWLEHTHDLIDHFAPFRDVMKNSKDDDNILAVIRKLPEVSSVLNKILVLWVIFTRDLDLLFHYIQTDVAFGFELIEQKTPETISATDFENILVFYIQAELLKQG